MEDAYLLILILMFLGCQLTVFLELYIPRDGVRYFRVKCGIFLVLDIVVYLCALFLAGIQYVVCLTLLIHTVPSLLFFYGMAKYKGSRFWVTYCVAGQAVSLAGGLGVGLASRLFGDCVPEYVLFGQLFMMASAAVLIFFVRGFFVKALCCMERGWELAAGAVTLLYLLVVLYFYNPEAVGNFGFQIRRTTIFMVSICLSLVLVLCTVYHIKRENEKIEEQQEIVWLMKMRIEEGERQYRDLMENMEKISIIRHDLSHHFRVIESCCRTGQYEKIQRYLDQIDFKETAEALSLYCDNHVANIILCYYAKEARQCGVSFECSADLPSGIPGDETDLSIILGNGLENALEACKKAKGARDIRVKMRYSTGRLALSIENTYNGNLQEENGRPSTGKQGEGHGLGFKSMERVVKKYRGYLNYSGTGRRFCLKIILNINCSHVSVQSEK